MGFVVPDFTDADAPATLIVHGRVGDPANVLAELAKADAAPAALSARHAWLTPGTGDLRLSSPGWIKLGLDRRQALPNTDDLYLLCRERLNHLAPAFAQPLRRFLEGYLDFVVATVEAHRDALTPTPPDSEVYIHRDWLFSAWLPLVGAQILLPPAFDDDGPAFAAVDAAFVAGGRIVAVTIDGQATPIKSRRVRQDYLFAHHPLVDRVRIDKHRIGGTSFPIDAFPPAFARFWDGLAMPMGPSPPDFAFEAGQASQPVRAS